MYYTCKDLIDYLAWFEPDAEISLVTVNPDKRTVHKIDKHIFLSDTPAIFMETTSEESLDDAGVTMGLDT